MSYFTKTSPPRLDDRYEDLYYFYWWCHLCIILLTLQTLKKCRLSTLSDFLLSLNRLEEKELRYSRLLWPKYKSVMVRVNSGVRSRILSNFLTPCSCRSWNLLLVKPANPFEDTKVVFDYIQKNYYLFSRLVINRRQIKTTCTMLQLLVIIPYETKNSWNRRHIPKIFHVQKWVRVTQKKKLLPIN